ncbi:MAG: RNA polymerase sigma factor [Nonlabens sp.]
MDQQARFQTLYKTHKDKVYRLCLGYLKGNEPLAVDLTQEVFIKAFQHWDNFKGNASRSTWLYRIAVNTCLNQLRNDKKYQKVDLQNISELPDETDNENGREHDFKKLYSCINKLNSVNKSIILLELEQMPQDEIAEVMGLSHGAVRTRINRIKDQLSNCITNEKF